MFIAVRINIGRQNHHTESINTLSPRITLQEARSNTVNVIETNAMATTDH
jgi:hypothetical protein